MIDYYYIIICALVLKELFVIFHEPGCDKLTRILMFNKTTFENALTLVLEGVRSWRLNV